MDRLRTILLLRALLAGFFVVLGVVLVAGGDAPFGALAIVVGIVNAGLIVVVARRVRRSG